MQGALEEQRRLLEEGERRYHFLADAVPQIIWTAKPDGKVDYFNQRWVDYTGLTLEQTRDWDWTPVLHPDDLQNCVDVWTKAVASGTDYEVEYRFKRASDGAYRWHLGRAFPLRDEKGKIIQWVGTCTDIDDQKRVRRELESRIVERTEELGKVREDLQSLLDAATHVSIIAGTPQGLITVFNSGAERMLGYTAEEMVGKQTPGLFHLESEMVARGEALTREMGRPIQGVEVFLAKARDGHPEEREWTYVRKDGRQVTVNLVVTASYEADGSIAGFLGIAMDVTARKKMEETLRISEERFRLIVDAVEDYALLMLDPRGYVASWNVGAERIKGYRAEEIIGQHFSRFYLPEAIAVGHPDEELRIAAKEGRYVEEGWRMRKDGSRFMADVVITSIHDNAGKLRGFAKVTRDITARKNAEKTLRDQSQIIDLANDAIFLRDMEDRIIYWNQGAERIYGWNKTEVQGKVVHDLLKTIFPKPLEQVRAQLLEEGHWEGELDHSRRDGTRLTTASRWTLQRDEADRPVAVIELNYDITEQKRAEQQLQEAKERAESADRAKSSFLAAMSHEIRTPMNGVIGMTSLLQETELTPDQREYVDTIQVSGDALLTLINDILDFSKIESGKINLEQAPFNLRQCIEETFDLFVKPIREKRLEVVYLIAAKVPTTVVGDVTRVRQILINLLGNAVKFTVRGEIVLNVTLQEEEGPSGLLHFSLSDTGIGISKDGMSLLFQTFQQLDSSTTRRFGGTGLGLAISKRLVELMGGAMVAESKEGWGSTFSFTAMLPAAPSFDMVSHREKLPPPLSVLIVEDHATHRRILSTQMSNWGMRPTTVSSGKEALEALQRTCFDVALIDWHLSDMDGVSLARLLKERSGMSLILLSSGEGIPSEASGLFRFHVSKPIKQTVLLECLQASVGRGSAKALKSFGNGIDRDLAKQKPLRILLAEDNLVNQKVGLMMLASLGYQGHLAGNGFDVLRLVEKNRYDLILMDIQMPEMDGIAALAAMRENRRDRFFPKVVALTANALHGEKERLLKLGFDDYLSKPLELDRLCQLLTSFPVLVELPEGPLIDSAAISTDSARASLSEP